MRTHAQVQAVANVWIEGLWRDKRVLQVGGLDGLVGRRGRVVDLVWDERGALHCKVAPGDWWCPATLLAQVGDGALYVVTVDDAAGRFRTGEVGEELPNDMPEKYAHKLDLGGTCGDPMDRRRVFYFGATEVEPASLREGDGR